MERVETFMHATAKNNTLNSGTYNIQNKRIIAPWSIAGAMLANNVMLTTTLHVSVYISGRTLLFLQKNEVGNSVWQLNRYSIFMDIIKLPGRNHNPRLVTKAIASTEYSHYRIETGRRISDMLGESSYLPTLSSCL